jgi:uncharacterized caspase-like protein
MLARLRAALGMISAMLMAAALLAPFHASAQDAQPPVVQGQGEKRIALVIGNAGYADGALPTTANDAGLIAQSLQAAGFDVVGARDLDQDALRHAFRDFLDKAGQSGPDTVAFVYLAGYGVQLEGQNYFVPVDARLQTPASIPSEAVRLSDLTQPLAGLHLKANMVVVDAARANNFAQGDQPLAGGLALMEANPNSLIAFNAAPGTVAPQEKGPYGAYAQALAETMRVGGLAVADVFDRVRLRVNEQTQGGLLPWSASRISEPFVFFDRGQGAPPPEATYYQDKSLQSKPIADFDAHDAYAAAIARDTLPAYQDFIATYPSDPMAKRVRAIIAARREAITWRESSQRDTPNAYWSYLKRYPRGPHAWDARRRLDYLSAALEPPPTFDVIDYDVPPPEEEEIVYVDRPVFVFSDPYFDLPPPPPPPLIFLPPPPRDFVVLAPPYYPGDPRDSYLLPTPPFVPVPEWVRPPRYVEAPPQNFIFDNLHNPRVINERLNQRPQVGLTPGQTAGAALAIGAGAAAVALPGFLRNRARPPQQALPGVGAPPVLPGAVRQPQRLPPGQALPPGQGLPGAKPLPGMNGQPLPLNNGKQVQPGTLPGQQPGVLPRNRNQPGGLRPLPGNQPGVEGQPGVGGQGAQPGLTGQPGQKGNRRLRNQPGATPVPDGQATPNALPAPTTPGATPGQPGRKRLRGQQPGAPAGPGADQTAVPGASPGLQNQPGGRRLRQQGQPQAQPQVQPNAAPQDNQQALPRAKRLRQGGQPQTGQPQGEQLQNGQPQRFNPQNGQRPRMQFQPPGADQAPRQQPRAQPEMQPRPQPQQQMRPRPEPQAPGAPAGRRCGRPGLPPCE